ncbi:hypothetical protein H3146_27290 [Streptomyces sp. OF3]|uniref:DUF5667 domain-containing protein n=1 Tax=Streptomyces alkaliterrae TaxID=2213162 RepID=A0A7W3ZQQ1_9ACTN|nr:DUF5667 domain-containing protein [Streptomyces alkaliterrae]MBB1257008.1 hypothetical protein [Streptomyces alkaliterrae]
MIGSVSTNRRANAFAQALGAPETPDASADSTAPAPDEEPEATGDAQTRAIRSAAPDETDDHEQAALLAVADGLAALPRPQLDPEVKTVQRAQLIAAMEAQFAGGQVPEQRGTSGRGAHRATPLGGLGKLRPKSRLTKGLAAGGLTVGVAAGAFGGVAAASTDALPGDRLYGLKRGMEDLKLDMAGSDVSRGRLHLDHASTRMHEARRLMERGRSGPLDHESLGEVRKALNAMSSNADEGRRLLSAAHERDGDLGPLRALSAFAESHSGGWEELRGLLPVQLRDVGEQVNSVFDAIKRDVSPIRELAPSQPGDDTPGGESPAEREVGGAERNQQRPAPEDAPDGKPTEKDGAASSSPSAPEGHKPDPEEKPDGLVGGGGGLLDPPLTESGGLTSGTGDSDSTAPDITIPPLLPGGLPGLSLDTSRED